MTGALRLTLGACSKYSIAYMLRTWHRTAGMFAAMFLLILTVTGLLLMQTDDLDLGGRYLSDDRLLDWYGIRPAPPPLSFPVSKYWITQLGNRLYFDTRYLSDVDGQLVGAISAADELLIATTQMLLLVTAEGALAEKLGAPGGVPADLIQIGTGAEEAIVLRSPGGLFIFDPLSARIQPYTSARPVRWSSPASLPATIYDGIKRGYRGRGLSIERVILDLHTGRLFGALGVALFNLASILLLLLIFSGIVLWGYRARHNRSNDANS